MDPQLADFLTEHKILTRRFFLRCGAGYAQVGISGLKKVHVWIHNNDVDLPDDDEYFATAPWRDAQILAPPKSWGGDIADDRIPVPTRGFDPQTGRPNSWPIRLTRAHWATLLPGLAPENTPCVVGRLMTTAMPSQCLDLSENPVERQLKKY